MNQHTFPEVLAVNTDEGHIYTDSLTVAKYFGKRHKHVLRDIEKLRATIPDAEFSWTNFGPRNYLDERGKSQPMFLLTKDGFSILTMGFIGTKALQWKVAFINAFNQMEAQLHAQTEREAQALYQLRPHWKTISQGLTQNLSRKNICLMTGHRSPSSITANKRRMREVGL